MKYISTILILSTMLFLTGCENTTDSKDESENVQSYSTVNIKEATEYFKFSTNSGSTNANSDHDVVFYSEDFQPAPQAPVIKDPRFRSKDGLSIAVINITTLEDIDEVPNNADFVTNFVSEMGEWYSETDDHLIIPYEKVYIVNTADGKFPAFQIMSYYDEQGTSGVYNIEWKYLAE